jgi:hypothetical protein
VVRLPSVIFSLIGCAGVYLLAQEVHLRRPLLAAMIYAIFPLQFRYAMIARPYTQAACWSVLATVVFLRLIDSISSSDRRASLAWAALYSLLITAGLYTHAYTIFVPIAHLIWVAWDRPLSTKDRSVVFVGGAIAVASLVFLPWFLKAHAAWQKIIGYGTSPYFANSAKGLVLLAHELTGAGYAGFALALIGAIWGLMLTFSKPWQRLFWILYILIPVLCVLVANALFGYFLAIRQFIFILVPFAVLIAAATEAVNVKQVRWGLLAPGFLVVAMLYANVRMLAQPGEGWQAAAAMLHEQAGLPHTCTLFVPPDALPTFVFFEPQLEQTLCDPGNLSASETVVVAIRSKGPVRFYSEKDQALEQAGFSKTSVLRAEEPRLEIHRRATLSRP